MNPEEVLNLAREEARAASHRQLQRTPPTADAHVINRARREYIDTLRAVSTRAIESLQENNMSKDQSNHNADDQEQEQDPADLSFPAHWPVTGPYANHNQE